MSKPYSTICLQCAKKYTPPSFWCDQCQVVILPGPDLLADIHSAAKNLQNESQNCDWVLKNVPSWKDRNQVSTEEETHLVNIFQNLKNQAESEFTKENQLSKCLLNLRSFLLLDQIEKDLPSKIRQWQDEFNNDFPPLLENAVDDLCTHLKEKAERVLAEKAKLLQASESLPKFSALDLQIAPSPLDNLPRTEPEAPNKTVPVLLPELPRMESKNPEPVVLPREASPSSELEALLHALEDNLTVIPDAHQNPGQPPEDQNRTAPAILPPLPVLGKPVPVHSPAIPEKRKPKPPLVSHHWKEGTTRWVKALKPFLLDNVGWFVGGFLVLAGFSYLIATLWNTMSQNPILWRTFVFLCLFGSTGFFTFLGHYLLKKHPNLELSGMVFLTMATLMFPMVMVCAMMIALLPPGQHNQPEPRSAGTSQVNP